jgi:hypothetical protein
MKGGDSVKSIKNTSVKSSKSVKKLYANVAAEPINKYIKKLRKSIASSKKKYFVFLDLKDINEIDELTDLLQDKEQLNYFFKNINRENPIKARGKDWGVWVTGFKHGAKNDSYRKLGLVAYNINKTPEFTTVIFFDSENFNENNISTKIVEMKEYLNDPSSRSGENYIKPVKTVKNSSIKSVKKEPTENEIIEVMRKKYNELLKEKKQRLANLKGKKPSWNNNIAQLNNNFKVEYNENYIGSKQLMKKLRKEAIKELKK